jgi:hypothetical protein
MARLTKLLILATVSVCTLTACGYQGGYRYECQDPQNWQKKECNEPECIALGSCTKDILGFDPEGQKP